MLAGPGGFEPPNAGIKTRCLNRLATAQLFFSVNTDLLWLSEQTVYSELLSTTKFYNNLLQQINSFTAKKTNYYQNNITTIVNVLTYYRKLSTT